MSPEAVDRSAPAYSSGRRTALVLCGTGAHGAYLSGVLRAIQEAGIRIDVVAGHGVGAAIAALAAIDGGSRLWDADGLWHSTTPERMYTWKPSLRAAGWMGAILVGVLAIPLLVLAAALVGFTLGFMLSLMGLDAGATWTATLSRWLEVAFSGEQLPTIVPRLALVIVAALAIVFGGGVIAERWRAPLRRRSAGPWWWVPLGAPIDADVARAVFSDALWQLIRGAAAPARPAADVVSRRYADVLAESVGQPGFRELLIVAADLDARRDIVLALLNDAHRTDFLTGGRDRRADVLDLTSGGRDRAIQVLAAAVTPPVVCEPALVGSALESAWRGETHRACDRPGACHRLLEEVAAAGVSQVIVASAAAPVPEPHRLIPPKLDPRHRLGDFVTAAESSALQDALTLARLRFQAVFTVRPTHNPVGPFDMKGAYDHASDRFQNIAELMARGYEDAYRDFIGPVVGGSGEQLGRPHLTSRT